MMQQFAQRPNSRCSALILSRLLFEAALFSSCILDRSMRRHLFTCSLTSLQPPVALCMKPFAWHSSSAAMISSHARGVESQRQQGGRETAHGTVPRAFFVCRWGCMSVDAEEPGEIDVGSLTRESSRPDGPCWNSAPGGEGKAWTTSGFWPFPTVPGSHIYIALCNVESRNSATDLTSSHCRKQ